ncbi:tetraspanin-8-like [Gasterosteus aculeatus]
MASVNTCLKLIFTIFNVFFAVVGAAIVGLALLFQVLTNVGGEDLEGRSAVLIGLYTVGAITMVIAVLGAYGAHRENRGCLIVFLVCMVIGSLMMLRAGVFAIYGHHEGERELEKRFRELLPLDQAAENVKDVADRFQTEMHCCGLFSYSDWEDNVPDSCLCDPGTEVGECQSVTYTDMLLDRKSVYVQTCFPIVLHYLTLIRNVSMGIVFALAALALLGMALSSTIIHQMRYPGRSTLMMTVPSIFTLPPPKYQELHNPPGY